MQQVADWLEKLGLGQYAQRFAENDISFAILPDLADQRLKEIGVSLGHRLQLLQAIAELSSGGKGARKPAVASAVSVVSYDNAERRHVTVMFSETCARSLRRIKVLAETVERFGGFIAKYMDDRVLIYFGYPQAHEDDAEGAVRFPHRQ